MRASLFPTIPIHILYTLYLDMINYQLPNICFNLCVGCIHLYVFNLYLANTIFIVRLNKQSFNPFTKPSDYCIFYSMFSSSTQILATIKV